MKLDRAHGRPRPPDEILDSIQICVTVRAVPRVGFASGGFSWGVLGEPLHNAAAVALRRSNKNLLPLTGHLH